MTFDKYATKGAYHYRWYKTEPWYRKCIDRCVDFCKGSTLDVGCGDGLVANLISKKHWDVCGIDNDETGIQLAADLASTENVYFLKQDINKPVGGSWEYMVCLNVIEHLEKPERILEIFKDNITRAAIIITDMPQEKPSKYHVKEFSPKELADMFSEYKIVPFQIDKDFHGIEVWK